MGSHDLDAGATADGDDGLTSEQRLALEAENDSMTREFESTLDQVRQAERSLTEIAQVQAQLATHLAQQMQETEMLYAEAGAATDRVKDGNFQLAEARKHMADTRKWILIFLLIASLILLFLDWYD
jgi:syntaxin 18